VTQKVHHQTERGARIALAKKQISQESYEAILQGELSLAETRKLGCDRGPHDTGQASGGENEARTGPRSVRADDTQSGAYCLCDARSSFAGTNPDSALAMMPGFTVNSGATWRRTRCCGTSGSVMHKRLMPGKGS
jgi:hypothetical protein